MSTKTIQGKLWSSAPEYWARHFEPWFLPMYKNVLSQLKLNEDQLLLDAGCGSGLFSYLAIEEGAQVIGVDVAHRLLEIARMRNPQNNFLEEDLESLPFSNNSFDVVTAFNSLQYANDFQVALEESVRVLKPGGKLAIGIWDKPEHCDSSNILKAINALLPPPPPGKQSPFMFSEDGRIENECEKAGLKMVYRNRVSCPFLYSNLSDAMKSILGTAPAAAAINTTSRRLVEETILRALQPFAATDDFYFLQNNFLVFIAEK